MVNAGARGCSKVRFCCGLCGCTCCCWCWCWCTGCCGLAHGVCSKKASSAAVRDAFDDMADIAPRITSAECCGAALLVVSEIWLSGQFFFSFLIFVLFFSSSRVPQGCVCTYPHLFHVFFNLRGPRRCQCWCCGKTDILGNTGHDRDLLVVGGLVRDLLRAARRERNGMVGANVFALEAIVLDGIELLAEGT